ncbi:unnamed protein product [Urochloa humidicola]
MGNNHCGYYVMHYIHCYTGNDFTALCDQEKEVDASEMIATELIALSEQLAGFLLEHIEHEDGEYNIMSIL